MGKIILFFIGMILKDFWILSLPFLGAMLGIFLGQFLILKKTIGLKLILSFSGAFLLGITIFKLLPNIFSHGNKQLSVFVMGGILFQIFLEYFSRGAEHGHYLSNTSEIFPITLWVSLCLHALIEGMPLYNQVELTYGIVIHKIPIGIILCLIMEKTNISFNIKWFGLILFSFMTPIGSFLLVYIPSLINFEPKITAWVMGMILHISTTILFESAENHKFNFKKLSVILIAVIIAYIL